MENEAEVSGNSNDGNSYDMVEGNYDVIDDDLL